MLAGQEALEQELARAGIRVPTRRAANCIERIAARLNYATPTDLFAAIGFGDASAQAVANRLRDEVKADNVVDLTKIGRKPARAQDASRKSSGVRIAGVDDVLVRLSKCCSPVPGDPIIGYVTIGRGVSVHRADCPNVGYMNDDARTHYASAMGRPTPVSRTRRYRSGSRRPHAAAARHHGRLRRAQDAGQFGKRARAQRRRCAVASLTVQIRDLDHLHKMLTKLERFEDVRRVYRVTKRERAALWAACSSPFCAARSRPRSSPG